MMKSRYLPDNKELIKEIELATRRLYNKLNNLNLVSLEISNYIMKYFRDIQVNLYGNLQKYSLLLSLCLKNYKKSLKDFVLIDYGGGSGIFSMLAKELGIGTVIYSDIYDISCKDAKRIANLIGNTADNYVRGEIQDVIRYLKNESIFCNALGSNDVIEHIYNIEYFVQKLSELNETDLTIVLATGANPYNPIIKRKLTKYHYMCEYKERKEKFGHKKRDTLKAYTEIRKELITNNSENKLSSKEIEVLTRLTRGCIDKDIEEITKNYLNNKVFPIERDIKFPTNTCDPYTGNWAERLMDPYDLMKLFQNNKFESQIITGLYEIKNKLLFRTVNLAQVYNTLSKLINLVMTIFPKKAIYLAPYYIIYAYK